MSGDGDGVDRTGKFNRVTVTHPDGTREVMTGVQFENLPFSDRIKVILTGKPTFSLFGREISAREALKGT